MSQITNYFRGSQ